jgi:predicted phage baseplate assembly protein
MPIRPPALDDRGFDDLVADLVRRIPAHTPEWTDPRVGDPGRTLIDLFAWLGDTILYRANLIPERQRLAFLRLLGTGMRPAQAATGLLQIQPDDKATTTAVTIHPRHPITTPVHFETLEEMTVLPVEGRCFIKRVPTDTEAAEFDALLPDLQELYSLSARPKPYVTTPIFIDGAPDMAGFDPAAGTVDRSIWIALFAPVPSDAAKKAAKLALAGGSSGQRAAISIGFAPFIDIPNALEPVSVRSPIEHVWEISGPGEKGGFAPLEVLADRTSGLTRRGTFRLLLPGGDDFGAPTNDVTTNMKAGVGIVPPRLDDPVLAARLVTWIRIKPKARIQPGTLRVSWLGINTVQVEARKTVGRQHVATGTGVSDQLVSLALNNVEQSTLAIEVEEEEGMTPWRQIPDVQMAGPGERVYSLDAEEGTIRFGDGMRGAVPATGRAIHVAHARTGGGSDGNLQAGTLKNITPPNGGPKLKLVQPLAMTGGVDAEALAEAEQRIPSLIRHADRAVTRADWKELALRTPGVSIGRVEVLERFKPHQRQTGMPGVVSIMVIPQRYGTAAPAPRADRSTLETVYSWLDMRRPLGTELYVIAPEYVPMGVSAAVELVDPAQRDDVLAAVSEVIRQHLWPLAPGGSDGSGWVLGRDVDDRLIETAIARVPGVRTVAPVKLFRRATNGRDWLTVSEDTQGRARLALADWQLPELAMLQVGVGATSATRLDGGGAGAGSGSGAGDDSDLAVPVVPEVC